VIALAAVSVAVGAALGVLMFQRLAVGESWDDWYIAEEPRWFTGLQVVLVAMFIAGFIVGSELAAVLIGVPGGFFLVFIVVGTRRLLRRDWSPREPVEVPEDEPRRPLWQRIALTVAWSAPLGAVAGILLFDTTGDVVAVTALSTFAGLLHELCLPALERWWMRRL
jgi:hypothetical protein